MSIKVYSTHKNLKYKYAKGGTYALRLTNNVSSAVFSGQELNGMRGQLVSVPNLDAKFTALGDYAFADCARLSCVNFNDTVERVGTGCFSGCSNLKEACLPPSVKSVGDLAFCGGRNLTCVGFKRFEDDDRTGFSSYALASVGNGALSGAACVAAVIPSSVNSLSKIGKTFLAGSNVVSLTLLGIAKAAAQEITSTNCFGIGHDCTVYTSDVKALTYQSETNSVTELASYSVYDGMKISTGRKDRMTLGRKIYGFTEELYKWCTVPSTQDPTKFAQRECPVVTIFCDLRTSVKSSVFAENVLKQSSLYAWMKENLKCYVFLMNRNGQISDSESSSDLSYYRTVFSGKGANTDFVTVNFVYKGNFNSVTLSEFTLTEFKKTLLDYCSKTGFDSFNTDGYDKIGDEPDAETIPSKSVDASSIAQFHSGGFDWYANNNAVTPASWNIGSAPMDFGLVATPDTTYVLVCGYDMKYSTDPVEVETKLFPIFQKFSDHAFYYDRCNSGNKKFLPGIAEGLKYRYLIFFEFSHGGSGSITIDGGVSKTAMWEALAPAKNRIFGMFDSCHSGSMFKAASEGSGSEDDDFDMAEYLVGKFERRKFLMSRLFGASTASVDPYMLMWSSTKANTYGWYYPQTATFFQRAICQAYGEMPYSRFAEIFPYVQKYGDKYDSEHGDYSTPQCKTYNVDFTKNKVFT